MIHKSLASKSNLLEESSEATVKQPKPKKTKKAYDKRIGGIRR